MIPPPTLTDPNPDTQSTQITPIIAPTTLHYSTTTTMLLSDGDSVTSEITDRPTADRAPQPHPGPIKGIKGVNQGGRMGRQLSPNKCIRHVKMKINFHSSTCFLSLHLILNRERGHS